MYGVEFDGLLGVLLAIGLATGVLTGLTGASGMSILISALLLTGIEIRQVIGLTFVITLVNSAISLPAYLKHAHVDWRSGLWVALPAMAAVMLGHVFSSTIQPGSLRGVMLVCLFAIGAKFLVSPKDPQQDAATPLTRPQSGWLVLMGSAAGFVMGIMGGGGAVFIGAALILIFKMQAKTAVGTSILIMGLAAIPGVVFHAASETIHASYVLAILASSIPAAAAASWFANRISSQRVKRLLGVYLLISSSFLLFRMFFE